MSYFPLSTAVDLKRDALRIAGEPQDGTSTYDDQVYDLLTVVQNALVSGGQLGPSYLQPVDWLWARAYPRGVVQMSLPVNGDYTVTATFTQGSKTVTLSGTLPSDIANYRLWIESKSTRPYVLQIAGTTLTLRDPWADVTYSSARWLAYQAEFDLPADFVRFGSPLFVSGYPYRVDLVEPTDLEHDYPFSLIYAGRPELAALVTDRKIRFSHFLGTTAQGAPADAPLQLEFEYIARPEPLTEGVIPKVAYEHRRVLSYGAGYLIQDDKSDTDRDRTFGKWQAQYKAMLDEFRRNIRNASSKYGVVIPRSVDQPARLRTESGIKVW